MSSLGKGAVKQDPLCSRFVRNELAERLMSPLIRSANGTAASGALVHARGDRDGDARFRPVERRSVESSTVVYDTPWTTRWTTLIDGHVFPSRHCKVRLLSRTGI